MKKEQTAGFSIYKVKQEMLWVFVSILLFLSTGCKTKWDIQNPYENVDWINHKKYKANLHTHTTRSDGRLNPHTAVDKYYELGYDILAITDHNEVTYPWTGFSDMAPGNTSITRMEKDPGSMPENFNYENRDPAKLGMIAIQGNEVSAPHHLGSYFIDYNQRTEKEDETFKATAERNGLIIINHPGRYLKRNPDVYNVDWYVDICRLYSHIIGVEVYNQGDRYPGDRQLWDSVLTHLMPGRPLWGFSNDDLHSAGRLGYNWNVFFLPELTEEWVRKGMEEGRFFYVYAPHGHNGPEIPDIESVKVNRRKGVIEILSSGQDSILWISKGKVLHKGSSINLRNIPEVSGYLRAEIFGPDKIITGTQPFAIKER